MARAEAKRAARRCMESPVNEESEEIWRRHSSARWRLPEDACLAHVRRSWMRRMPLSSGFIVLSCGVGQGDNVKDNVTSGLDDESITASAKLLGNGSIT